MLIFSECCRRSSYFLLIGLAALVGSVSLGRGAWADEFWTKSQLANSSWNSSYTTPDGSRVLAQLKFKGSNGTYDTSSGQGRLYDIEYGVDTQSRPGMPFFQITGKWSFQGTSGRFLLASNGRDEFKGSWNGSIGSGKWNGTSMYGPWQTSPGGDRMFCEYRYPSKDNPAKINVQIVIYFPDDEVRNGYYYFANKENKIWGRCVCPKNPAYDENSMQWSKLDGSTWNDLPAGECPAPKDGDPSGAAVDNIPLPPA